MQREGFLSLLSCMLIVKHDYYNTLLLSDYRFGFCCCCCGSTALSVWTTNSPDPRYTMFVCVCVKVVRWFWCYISFLHTLGWIPDHTADKNRIRVHKSRIKKCDASENARRKLAPGLHYRRYTCSRVPFLSQVGAGNSHRAQHEIQPVL